MDGYVWSEDVYDFSEEQGDMEKKLINLGHMVTMAELGIGTALNYSLYKPVANKDYEKIKSYMLLYKKSYRIIGLVVAGIGLAISPFLPALSH